MKTKKTIIICLFCCLFVTFTAQTRFYNPASEWEQSLYDVADRSVWPDDVRNSFEDYSDTKVAWTGIVENFSVDESFDEYNVLWLYAKHHYYDWIEDLFYSTPILLSPSGEGHFVTYWVLNKQADLTSLTEDLKDMLIIAYGTPFQISDDEDKDVYISGEYVRFIDDIYVNPNWLDYGRGGLSSY